MWDSMSAPARCTCSLLQARRTDPRSPPPATGQHEERAGNEQTLCTENVPQMPAWSGAAGMRRGARRRGSAASNRALEPTVTVGTHACIGDASTRKKRYREAHLRFSTLSCRSSGRVLFRCTSARLLVHRRPRAGLFGFRGLRRLLASGFPHRRAGPSHGGAQGRGSRPCHARVGIPLDCDRLCRPLPRLRCAPRPLRSRGGWEWIGRLRALACCAARFRHRGRRRPLLSEPCLHPPHND